MFVNERDGISAIELLTPAIDSTKSGDVLCTCCRTASAMSKCAATVEVVVENFCDHDTAAVLSQ